MLCRRPGSILFPYTTLFRSVIEFNSGFFSSFTASNAIFSGAGAARFTGGSLTLLSDRIPGRLLYGGALNSYPGFQGGSITNLTLSGMTLGGNNTVNGVCNWT